MVSNHARNLVLVHFWQSGAFESVAHNYWSPLFIALPVFPLRTTSRWQLIIWGLIALYLRSAIEIRLNVVQCILVIASSPLAFFILHSWCRQSSRLVLLPFVEFRFLQAVHRLKDTILLGNHDSQEISEVLPDYHVCRPIFLRLKKDVRENRGDRASRELSVYLSYEWEESQHEAPGVPINRIVLHDYLLHWFHYAIKRRLVFGELLADALKGLIEFEGAQRLLHVFKDTFKVAPDNTGVFLAEELSIIPKRNILFY